MRKARLLCTIGAIAFLAACATSPATYTVCEADGCGDNVAITVDEAK